MPILIVKRYTRQEIQEHPYWLYVFGDNLARIGSGGQARETRGEPNTIGIVTKKAPTYEVEDFFTDDEYLFNVMRICDDMKRVVTALEAGSIVVWPEDGIGTGIANLKTNAPKTLAFIEEAFETLCKTFEVIN